MSTETKHSPVRGHSTNPRAEPKTVGEWQSWSETLQSDMEAHAGRIHELELALESERASVSKYRDIADQHQKEAYALTTTLNRIRRDHEREVERLHIALKETEAANADALQKNGRLLEEAKSARVVNFVFDGPPGPKGPRFVEVENGQGQSIRVGEWKQRPLTATGCSPWRGVDDRRIGSD